MQRVVLFLEDMKPHRHMTSRYVVAALALCKDLAVAWEHALP